MIIQDYSTDCGRHLNEPEFKLMEPVVQLLCGIAAGSDPAAACVIPHVMPVLFELYPALSQVCATILWLYSLLACYWLTVARDLISSFWYSPLLDLLSRLL